MNKFVSIISIISTLLLQSTLTVAQREKIVHIHINDENNSDSQLHGLDFKFTANEDEFTTLESNKVSGKAMVDNGGLDLADTNVKSSGSKASYILIPIIAMICIYGIASIGLFIKKKQTKKSKPRRKSLHFEDDDELSRILVQKPNATAINETLTVRSINQEKGIGKSIVNKIISNKEVTFLPINHAYKVILPWTPKHLDEVSLRAGDIVCIKKCYSDGYSYGRNVTSRVDGIFPTCCVSSMDESIDQAAIEKWINTGMGKNKKRTTSLFLKDITYKA